MQSKINPILNFLPNLALDDVPLGKDEKLNKELKKIGKIPQFNFKTLSHYELGEKLNLMDFNLATKTSGSRFVFLKGKLAELERAISNFMIDVHTKEFAYQEISPPLIVTETTMFGTGQLPKFKNDQFEIKLEGDQKKFLIPTAEVILTNMVRENSIKLNDLPIRLVASTACFRKEAGSYGKDTKGMIRQHQFYKVELVSIVEPKKCVEELDRMINCAEQILKKLNLPYRSVLLCSGDMGFSAEKTVDLEVWIPSENKYREISSCSSCGQFQSRRMKAKYKDSKNKSDFANKIKTHVNNHICKNVYRATRGCMEISGGYLEEAIVVDVNSGLSTCALYIRTYVDKDLNPDLWDSSSSLRKSQTNSGDVGSYGGTVFEMPSWC